MKIIYSLLIFWVALPCKAQRVCGTYNYVQTQPAQLYSRPSLESTAGSRDTMPGEIITVPVIIHILYNQGVENISDAQVLSQIESLNKDYRKLNNVQNIPAAFASYASDVKIIFCLAKTDPEGRSTTGIIHKYTQTQNWLADDEMKFSASQGDDAWDSKRYLNIWVCNLFGRNLGYSSLPGGPSDKDGIVIQYDVFGTIGAIRSPFDKGRTATHEVGHWLGLMHLWGDAVCGDDRIADTPPQKSYNNGCPSFPHTSTCSINQSGDMFMNYMDFTDDGCMSMFTNGQKNEMRSLFALGNYRNSFLTSNVCNPAPESGPLPSDSVVISKVIISLYPNPSRDFIIIEAKNSNELTGQIISIYNVLGREVKTQLLNGQKNIISINNFPAGIYIVKIGSGKEVRVTRFLKQ